MANDKQTEGQDAVSVRPVLVDDGTPGAFSPAPQAGASRAHDIPSRGGAVFDETANLSIGDSAAMTNEHRISLSGFMRTSAFYFYR